MGFYWWWNALLPLALVGGQEAGPPTWADGSVLTITPMGLGNLLLSWPVAENNVYELIGYKVLYSDSATDTVLSVPRLIFDGTNYVAIRQFLVTGLTPGNGYSFYIQAMNIDPSGTAVYTSASLFRSYTLASAIGLDPTTLDSTWINVTAGETFVLPIYGRQPSTGNLQDVGPICLVTQQASCVPGRTFVAFIQPVCELVQLGSLCRTVTEGSSVGFNAATLPFTSEYVGPTSVAFDENNVGQYKVELTGERAGIFSLGLHAVTPNQLLALYWNNPSFSGDPFDTKTDAMIDFHWSSGAITAWASEYVSVRWLGYIKPESSGDFDFTCIANTYCDVWIDDEHFIDSQSSACIDGCYGLRTLSLRRSHFYKLRVDYVTTTGDSYVSLQWKGTLNGLYPSFTPIPSNVFQRSAYVAQSPLKITVAPGRISGSKSYIYGSEEALFSPLVGKRYTLFIQANDEYGNACSLFNVNDVVKINATGVNEFSLIASPYNSSVKDCVYAVQLTYTVPGNVRLSGSVNGEPFSNSPVEVEVSPGTIDPLFTSTDLLILRPSELLVHTPFDVSIVPTDSFGNRITGPMQAGDVRWKLERDPLAFFSSNDGCGSRNPTSWTVYCWNGEFTFVDDSLLVAQSFPPFLSGKDFISLSNGTIQLVNLSSSSVGPHLLSVFIGDTMVSQNAFSFTQSLGISAANASMSLVQWANFPDTVTQYETDISALVLIRDQAGNILPNISDADVRISVGTRVVSCTYIPAKYYKCDSYADSTGLVQVNVTVNGALASVTTGTAPSVDACTNLPFCGSKACPCSQYRSSAVRTVQVISA
jgi:hypothetical protein